MGKLWAVILAVSLLGFAALARAEEPTGFTRVVIPVVNQTDGLAVLSLDGGTTLPGHRYLEAGRAVTLEARDPAQVNQRSEHEHILNFSLVRQGVEPWCSVKVKTANTAGRPGSLLTYCAAAASDEHCALQVYSEAQVCWVLVQIR